MPLLVNMIRAAMQARPATAGGEQCALCGKVATGFAGINGDRYCHGDDATEPTCYMQASRSTFAVGASPSDFAPAVASALFHGSRNHRGKDD